MKRVYIWIAVLIASLSLSQAEAQNWMSEGRTLINIGAGITNGYVPLSASIDYGVADGLFDGNGAFSVGGLTGVLLSSKKSGLFIGPRAGIHYHFIPDLDTYFTLMLGYSHRTHAVGNNNGNKLKEVKSGFEWGAHIGTRYRITDQFGAFIELGYGWAFVNVGVSIGL